MFKPTLPSGLKLMNWRFQYRSVWYDIELTENKLMLRLCDYGSESVTVKLNNKTYQLQGNQTLVLSLDELSLKS
ncbi:glycosyl hydrolase family 65 protein [Coxiella burnetii]|uniref:glycosyl hydrolase family 65 protein n=1 Tax=Coxiella burnetii TaxID=777 RepID=UPI00222EF88D|nr:glycosyl hydrolase family 65 protein [Coxiella burnetii]